MSRFKVNITQYRISPIEHKFESGDWVLDDEDNLFQVTRVRDNEIALTDEPYYVPAKEYRLKEEEDVETLFEQSSKSTSSKLSDNSCTSDSRVSKMTIPIIEVDEEMDREIDEYFSSKAEDSAPKKHWYDEPLNFPVRLVRDTEQYVTYRWVYKREDFIKAHRQGFKLVTEDNCTLIRSMF